MGNSSRKRPLEPPLSATVTIAVISVVNFRTAASVAARPCPPPKHTMRGLTCELIHALRRDVKHAH